MPPTLDVFLTFLRLGCTSFGGPVAHLAYFEAEFVRRRGWLSSETFGECVALTQMLPGPGSSQTGMLIGWLRYGFLGAIAAWIGFTVPSAVLMSALALVIASGSASLIWMHCLLVVATGVVASAIAAMRASLASDAPRLLIAIGVAAFMLLVPTAYATLIALAASAMFGALFLRAKTPVASSGLNLGISRRAGIALAITYVIVFAALELSAVHGPRFWQLAARLFWTGSFVFGGGHVVLPLLQQELTRSGMLDSSTILSGYAAAQAMPGPLFSIASFVGATAWNASLGFLGSLFGTIAIFAPSFFLLGAIAPFYTRLAHNISFRNALAGTNAGVIGLLAATFVHPIFTSTIRNVLDGLLALLAFVLIHLVRVPAWPIVLVAAVAGFFLGRS